jgi:hypothetical protein
MPVTWADEFGNPHPKSANTYDKPIASACLINGSLPCKVKWHEKNMPEPASLEIIKNHLLPTLREANRIAPTSHETVKIVIDNLGYAMHIKRRTLLNPEQQNSLEKSFISTSNFVANLLRFVEKWTPVMSSQVDDFDKLRTRVTTLEEKLNRLKTYTNNPSTKDVILY